MYVQSEKSQDPFLLNASEGVHVFTVPTSVSGLTMALHIKLFTPFVSLARHSPGSWMCFTTFLCTLDVGGFQSFSPLALLSLSVFSLSLFIPSNIQLYCSVYFPGSSQDMFSSSSQGSLLSSSKCVCHSFLFSLWREQQPWTEDKRPGFRLISQLNRWPLTPLSFSSFCLHRFIPRSHRGRQFCSLSFCNLALVSVLLQISSWFVMSQ